MHTITTFANKGGAGRTTAVMALACGFRATGKRVAVMDCSGDPGWHTGNDLPSMLRSWKLMAKDVLLDIDAHPFRLFQPRTSQQIEDEWAVAKAAGFDVLLIDTQHRLEKQQSVSLGLADLVIAPANGTIEAKCTADSIHDVLGFSENVFGLITGCRNGAAEAFEMRATFRNHSVFQSELPWAEVFNSLSKIGNIERFVASLHCTSRDTGFARYSSAHDAWQAVRHLTQEVGWALRGYRLTPFNTDHPVYGFQREAVA